MGWWSLFDWAALATVAGCLAYVVVRPPPRALWPSLPVALALYVVWMIGDLGTTRDLERPHLWLTLLHGAGVLEVCAAWIVGLRFAEAYGRPFSWARSRWVYAPVGVSLLFAAIVVTNPWHGQYLTPVPGTRSEYHWLADATAVYGHGLSAVVVVLFAVVRARHRSWLVRRKATLLMAAYAAGPICNLLYAFWPGTAPPFDMTVVAIMWSTSLVMVGIYRSGLFNPLPVALPEVIAHDPSPVVLVDPRGYPFLANEAARACFPASAWTPDVPFYRHMAEVLRTVDDAALEADELERQLGGDDEAPYGRTYAFAGPPRRWMRIQRSPIRTSAGLEVGSCIRFHDVTALLEAEASVRTSEARFRALADHADDFVAEVDAEGHYLYVNPRHLEVFGHSRETLMDLGGFGLMVPEDRPRALERFAKMFETGEVAHETFRMVDASGRLRWTELAGRPFSTPSGERRAVVIGRDVTQREHAHERRRLEDLGTLAGGLARDLNDLLVPILGNTSFLLEEVAHQDDKESILSEIESHAARAADLVARLLAYVGEAPLATARVDLAALIRDMRPSLERAGAGRGSLRFELATALPRVEVDPGRIRHVVTALVENAWEALPARGGRVTVGTYLVRLGPDDGARPDLVGTLGPGEYIACEVSDTGCGMDEELRAHIFDPFFTTKGSGRGLGLAAALGTVRTHGGTMRVRTRPGQGASFEVLLPRPR